MAVANSFAGVEGGARQIECTINGIGERAGNAALEEIAAAIATRHDRYPYATNLVMTELYPTSHMLGEIISFTCPPTKPSSEKTPSPTSPASTSTASSPTPSPTKS